jgi:hypothetical protein
MSCEGRAGGGRQGQERERGSEMAGGRFQGSHGLLFSGRGFKGLTNDAELLCADDAHVMLHDGG